MSKDYIYPEEFESVWGRIEDKRASRKEIAYKVFVKLYDSGINEQIKAKDKWIKELLKNRLDCEKCGCTELLCGHNKRD